MNTKLFKPLVIEFEDKETLYRTITDTAEELIINSINENGNCRLLLAGGTSPLPIYKSLSQSPAIVWSEVEIFQSDERLVETDTAQSNQFQISNALGQDIIRETYATHFFDTKSQELALEKYNEVIDSLDDVLFDVAILGIGSDGHIASLFPEGNYLKHLDTHCVATIAPKEFEISSRVSLSIESILSTKQIVVIILGEKKSELLSELLEGQLSASKFPAKFLLSHPQVSIYYSPQ
jgi:6-phosphogluconolactonase